MIGPSFATVILALLAPGEGRPADSIATVAGNYLFFGGVSPSLRLTVTAEGRYTAFSQNLAVIEESRGAAEVRDGRLILTPERPGPDLEAKGFSTKLVPVHWGERLILVPEGRAREFCNLANLGLTSAHLQGIAYVSDDYRWQSTPAFGRPDVPPEWAPMLLKQPVEGRVIEVISDVRARVDFGSDRGAVVGLEVWVANCTCESIGIGCALGTVVEVTPASCTVELKPPVYESNRFKAGQRIFSRHPLADGVESLARKAASEKARRPATP